MITFRSVEWYRSWYRALQALDSTLLKCVGGDRKHWLNDAFQSCFPNRQTWGEICGTALGLFSMLVAMVDWAGFVGETIYFDQFVQQLFIQFDRLRWCSWETFTLSIQVRTTHHPHEYFHIIATLSNVPRKIKRMSDSDKNTRCYMERYSDHYSLLFIWGFE